MPNAQVSIRNLDTKVVARLKDRAKQHGRSLASEIRIILQEAVPAPDTDYLTELRRIHADLGARQFSDSTELIRQDRNSR